jgi:hypothetical protein
VLPFELVAQPQARRARIAFTLLEDRRDRLGPDRGRAAGEPLALVRVGLVGQEQRGVDVRERPGGEDLRRAGELVPVSCPLRQLAHCPLEERGLRDPVAPQ